MSSNEQMKPAASALVIDDEPQIRRLLRVTLEANGYRVFDAANGHDGLVQAAQRRPDVVLLDLGLPDLDGVKVLKRLREWSRIPVIVLSVRDREDDKINALDAGADDYVTKPFARAEGLRNIIVRDREDDKINALDAGADDYVTKPFGAGELLARVRAALRHNQGQGAEAMFHTSNLEVDLAARVVRKRGQEVKITPIEYSLLRLFVTHAGKVLTHRHLLSEVWGPKAVTQSHYLRVHIAPLREKIEDDPAQPKLVITEPAVGYRLMMQ